MGVHRLPATSRFLREYKDGKPCVDCARHFPHYVLDFDHVRGHKHKPISELSTLASIMAEIRKCDLVCANCHRKRTFSRRQDLH